MSKIWRKITAACLYGGATALCVYFLRVEKGEELNSLCDAFSFAGVGLCCVSVWSFLQSQGAFLGIGYVVKTVKEYLLPFAKASGENYAAYRERKLREDKKTFRAVFLLVGLFYLLVACALL